MGSLSERVRVIHVVGQTPKPFQAGHKMIHHSVGTYADHQVCL
jgi:pyruvate decarboxylase